MFYTKINKFVSLFRKTEEEEEMEGKWKFTNAFTKADDILKEMGVEDDGLSEYEKRNYLINKVKANIYACDVYEKRIKGLSIDCSSTETGEVMTRLVKLVNPPLNADIYLAEIVNRKEDIRDLRNNQQTSTSLGHIDDELVEILDLFKRFYSELIYQKLLRRYREENDTQTDKIVKGKDFEHTPEKVRADIQKKYLYNVKQSIEMVKYFEEHITADDELNAIEMDRILVEMDQEFKFTYNEFANYVFSRTSDAVKEVEEIMIDTTVILDKDEYTEYMGKMKYPYKNLLNALDLVQRLHKHVMISKYEIE